MINNYYNNLVNIFPKTISTDQQLDDLMKKYKLNNLNFLGVYARDKKPKLKKNDCIIFNTDNHDKQGEHWVALCNNYVYDSFGSISIFKFNKKYNKTDKKPEQKIFEENCGYRCIAWILCCDKFGVKETSNII